MTPLRRHHCRNAVTLADRGGEHIGDEDADGLRLLIVVGASGAFVAALRSREGGKVPRPTGRGRCSEG